MSTTLYTRQECGCLSLAVVNDTEAARHAASDIAREIREGRLLHEMPTEEFRQTPWTCEPHAREQAERATLIPLGIP